MDYKVLTKVGQATSQGDTSFNSTPAAETSNLLFIENMEVTAKEATQRHCLPQTVAMIKRTTALPVVSVLHNSPCFTPAPHQQQKPLHFQAGKSFGHLE